MSPPDLQQPVLASLLGAGFAAAFLHAALPTHWLPFVLVGRAQRWTLRRTLGAVVAAGLAHIATTAVVGAWATPGFGTMAGVVVSGPVEYVRTNGAASGLPTESRTPVPTVTVMLLPVVWPLVMSRKLLAVSC